MYVRARLEQADNEQAITLPQQAVMHGTDGASVLVVGADGKVAARPIQAESTQGDKWIVREGLKAGDQVMVEGFQKRAGRARQAGAVASRRPGSGRASAALDTGK